MYSKEKSKMAEAQADIGLIGLAVMGQNLILNMNDHGFVVCAFNRTVSKVDDFLANEAKGTKVVGAHSMEELVAKLKKPRRIMLLVKAGAAVDAFIAKLLPLMDPGDIVIDGGNSEYTDTQRRAKELSAKGFLFVGSGVSGGEEGARYGPSLMPGGTPEAWPHIKPIFQAISAKTDGEPCCNWVGNDGAGHYVKMVHNGIEYGDMQLISEAYQLLKDACGLNHEEMSQVFSEWNKTELDSFLIEITADILKFKDEDGHPLVTKILDSGSPASDREQIYACCKRFGRFSSHDQIVLWLHRLSSLQQWMQEKLGFSRWFCFKFADGEERFVPFNAPIRASADIYVKQLLDTGLTETEMRLRAITSFKDLAPIPKVLLSGLEKAVRLHFPLIAQDYVTSTIRNKLNQIRRKPPGAAFRGSILVSAEELDFTSVGPDAQSEHDAECRVQQSKDSLKHRNA